MADEPMLATAGATRSWLALEDPGPWGPRAPADSRLDPGFAAALTARTEAAGVSVLLVRGARADTARRGGMRRCLLAGGSGRDERFLEIAEISRPQDALDLDLETLGRGVAPGHGVRSDQRHYLICTNGKRDPCCALRGRPVARAVGDRVGQRAWHTTHLGAHRFAANMLVLPDALLFGRLDPAAAVRVTSALEKGRLDLAHLRGRSGLPAQVQAAEVLLRTHLEVTGAHELTLLDAEVPTFSYRHRVYRVTVAARTLPPRPVACRGDKQEAPIAWRLSTITELEEFHHA